MQVISDELIGKIATYQKRKGRICGASFNNNGAIFFLVAIPSQNTEEDVFFDQWEAKCCIVLDETQSLC